MLCRRVCAALIQIFFFFSEILQCTTIKISNSIRKFAKHLAYSYKQVSDVRIAGPKIAELRASRVSRQSGTNDRLETIAIRNVPSFVRSCFRNIPISTIIDTIHVNYSTYYCIVVREVVLLSIHFFLIRIRHTDFNHLCHEF